MRQRASLGEQLLRSSVAGSIAPTSLLTWVVTNRCHDDRHVKTQDYGIWVAPEVSYAMLRDNLCLDAEALIAGLFDEGNLSDHAGNKVTVSLGASAGRDLSIALVSGPPSAAISLSEEGRVSIVWPAGADGVFTIEYKDSVSTADWSVLHGGIRAVSGEALVYDTLENTSDRYYRIIRE